MQRIINVPQGYSARITKAAVHNAISGLYTEGFSSCNIVACFSPEKMILMHVDVASAHQLAEELEWIDGERTIIIMYRANDTASIILNKIILKHLSTCTANDSIQSINVRDAVRNVFIAFNLQDYNANIPIVKFATSRPENLIRHPQEQQFLAVQKIKQIVGLQAKIDAKILGNKKTNIFDNLAWETMGPNELEINTDNHKTKSEMLYFNKNDNLLTIAQKLRDISLKLTIPVMIEDSGYIDTASHLEQHLNNYNYCLAFKGNLKDLFNSGFHKPITKSDKSFNNEMKQITNENGDIFEKVTAKINNLILSDYKNDYQKSIIAEYNMFATHYKESRDYVNLIEHYNQLKQQVIIINKTALQNYKNQNYSSAAKLFLQAINLLTLCSIKDDPSLASSYYNYGKSLYNDKKFIAAKDALSISLELREKYTQPKPSDLDLAKTREAVAQSIELLKPVTNTTQKNSTNATNKKSPDTEQKQPISLTPYYKYQAAGKTICNKGTMIVATTAAAAMSAYYYNNCG